MQWIGCAGNGYAVTGVLAIVEIRVLNARQIPQNNGVYCAIRTELTALVVITATRQKCQGKCRHHNKCNWFLHIIFAIYILSAKVIILFLSRKFEKLFYIKSGQKTCFPVLGLIHDAIKKLFAECFGSFPHVMKNTRHLF